MINDVAEDHIGEGIQNLGNGHHHADRPDGHADLVGIEILKLPHQVGHNAQRQLAAHVRQLVRGSHAELYAFRVNLFPLPCHV